MSSKGAATRGVVLLLALVCVALSGLIAIGPSSASSPADVGAEDDRLRVMFVGDSITHGQQGDATYRYFVWREFARQQVPVTFVGPYRDLAKTKGARSNYLRTDLGFETSHAARAGSKFGFHLRQAQAMVRTYQPDVISLMIGYNNSAKNSAMQIAIGIVNYMQLAWVVDPEVKFVLGELLPVARKSRAVTAQRNRVVAEVNRLLAFHLSNQPLITIANSATDPARPWRPLQHTHDGLHPRLLGQSLLGYQFAKAFQAAGLLPRQPAAPTSMPWAIKPRIESLRVLPGMAKGRRTVIMSWPGQFRRIYVKGFRLDISRVGGRRVVRQDSRWKKTARVRLRPGVYRARLIAGRGAMISAPGPVRKFRVR